MLSLSGGPRTNPQTCQELKPEPEVLNVQEKLGLL